MSCNFRASSFDLFPFSKVGLAAQLPSGPNSAKNLDYRTFWDFLSRKQQAFEDIPQERLEGLS